jgi:hypothetical protein
MMVLLKIKSHQIQINTVLFPNSAENFLSFFIFITATLFYIRSKKFFHIRNLWILLFQMIYIWSLFSHIFILKLSVYGNELRSTELGCNSLILSISRKLSLILRFLINYIEKKYLWRKMFFSIFFERNGGEVC